MSRSGSPGPPATPEPPYYAASGNPFSKVPSWAAVHEDLDRSSAIALRPIEITNAAWAVHHILSKAEAEYEMEEERRQRNQMNREYRLAKLGERHNDRHEKMSAIGVEPVKHGFGQKLERRRHHMQTSASMSSLGGFSSIPGDEAGSTIKRPKPIVLPTPGLAPADEQVELATAEVIMSGAVSPESRGHSRPQTASDRPLSPNLAGLEGLLIPRYTNRSPSPTKSGRASPEPLMAGGAPAMAPPPPNLMGGGARPGTTVPGDRASSGGQGGGGGGGGLQPAPSVVSISASAVGSRSSLRTPAGTMRPVSSESIARSQSVSGLLAKSKTGHGGSKRSVSTAIAVMNSTAEYERLGGTMYRLGWAERYGQPLGRPPRRMPMHFEGGLHRGHPPPPALAYLPGANRGPPRQMALPESPSLTKVGTAAAYPSTLRRMMGSAGGRLPPSPGSLARAARALAC